MFMYVYLTTLSISSLISSEERRPISSNARSVLREGLSGMASPEDIIAGISGVSIGDAARDMGVDTSIDVIGGMSGGMENDDVEGAAPWELAATTTATSGQKTDKQN